MPAVENIFWSELPPAEVSRYFADLLPSSYATGKAIVAVDRIKTVVKLEKSTHFSITLFEATCIFNNIFSFLSTLPFNINLFIFYYNDVKILRNEQDLLEVLNRTG